MTGYTGAILAAGLGRRFGPLAESLPKALTPIANKPLIVHHVATLKSLGVEEALVVLGHGGERIAAVLGDGSSLGVRIRYVEQGDPLGSGHAVAKLAPHVDGPLVLLLGDYWFVAPQIGRLLELADGGASAVAAKRESDRRALLEACTLEVDGAGRVLRVVEKPKVPQSDLKGCGIYVLQPEFFDAVRRTPRTALRDEYELSVALDLYVSSGQMLYADEVIESDVNVTRPRDILWCNLMWLRRAGTSELVGPGARLAPGATLDEVVVGANVEVEQPIVLRRLVIFEGARVTGREPMAEVLVTPDGVLSCPLNNIEEHKEEP